MTVEANLEQLSEEMERDYLRYPHDLTLREEEA